MIAVITGDIIKSRSAPTKAWLAALKKELSKLGDAPRHWEVYRGDSFQAEIKVPVDVLKIVIQIKAALKSMRGVDVRMAIGLGDKTHSAKQITESTGSAFVFSGELVEELKKRKVNLAVRSNNAKFDAETNLYLKLALLTMDRWTAKEAETVHAALQHPDKSQKELGKLLRKKQNTVSTRLERAHYDEIREVIDMYRTKVSELSSDLS